MTGQAAYTYTRALGNSLSSSQYLALRLTPRHSIYYRLDWRPGQGWEVTNTVRYLSKQFQFDGERGQALPAHALWDARIAKSILAAEIYFGLENILDRRYAETFDWDPATGGTSRNPHPGRTYSVGASMRFQD